MVDEFLQVQGFFKVAVTHLQGDGLLLGFSKLRLVVCKGFYRGIFLFRLGERILVGDVFLRLGPLRQRIARSKCNQAVCSFCHETVVGVGAVHVLNLEYHGLVSLRLFGAGLSEFVQHGVRFRFPLRPQGLNHAETFQVSCRRIGVAGLVQGVGMVKNALDNCRNSGVGVGDCSLSNGLRFGRVCRCDCRNVVWRVQTMVVQCLRVEVDFLIRFDACCRGCLGTCSICLRDICCVCRFGLRVRFRGGGIADARRQRECHGTNKTRNCRLIQDHGLNIERI